MLTWNRARGIFEQAAFYHSHCFIFMKKKITIVFKYILFAAGIFASGICYSQTEAGVSRDMQFSLEMAIKRAHEASYDAQVAKYNLMGRYWGYRSYKAELLPSLNLSGDLLNFDRSLTEARDPHSGRLAYVDNNTLNNNLSLSIDQNIPFLGGKISVSSYIRRLDQFNYDQITYRTQPLLLTYTQPLRLYNDLKWKKKTEPLKYELAKRQYLERMENITLRVTSLFFSVLSQQANYRQSIKELADREELYRTAEKRFKLGTVVKSEILQLELSLLNAKMAVNRNKLNLDNRKHLLFSYLQMSDYENVELLPPFVLPELDMNVNSVIDKALSNSSYKIQQNLDLLTSEQELARLKSAKGIQMELYGKVGLSKSASKFPDAYNNLKDNEVVGLRFRMPIYDWGLDKGKVKMAEANLKITKTEITQKLIDFEQEIRNNVLLFNSQAEQCRISIKASEIADERYEIVRKRFENNTVTVTDLNTAMNAKINATNQYIDQLQTYWSKYFELQKITLYDFINHRDISEDFDKLVK